MGMTLYTKVLPGDTYSLSSWIQMNLGPDFVIIKIEIEMCPTNGKSYVITYLNSYQIY